MPIPGAHAEVFGLELIAESVGGRRNRIDTVLVKRVPPRDDDEVTDENDDSETEAAEQHA